MDGSPSKKTKLIEATWQDIESSRDILSNIFSKLPAVDLALYRFVSSHWRRVIGCPKLAEKQLTFAKENPVFLLYPFVGEVTAVCLVDTNGAVLEALHIPGLDDLSTLSMNCCYNGLVCFTNCPWEPNSDRTSVDLMDLEIRICNPCTRKVHLLPPGTLSKDEPEVGLVFGPSNSEYKVFRIYHSAPKSEGKEPLCEVYTPHSGAWRGIGNVPKCPMNSNNVFVDGKLYWFLPSEDDRRTPSSILVVDMEEKFRTIALPEEVTAHAFLLELDSCLCMVVIHDDQLIMDVWLLEYNNAGDEYWERKTSEIIPYTVMETTDAAAGIKDRIFLITSNHFYIYDIGSRIWYDLPFVSEFADSFPTVFSFTGSLLPCDGVMVLDTDLVRVSLANMIKRVQHEKSLVPVV